MSCVDRRPSCSTLVASRCVKRSGCLCYLPVPPLLPLLPLLPAVLVPVLGLGPGLVPRPERRWSAGVLALGFLPAMVYLHVSRGMYLCPCISASEDAEQVEDDEHEDDGDEYADESVAAHVVSLSLLGDDLLAAHAVDDADG